MMDTAVFENDTLTIRAGAFATEIHVKQIDAKWNNLSLDPERRARGQLNMLAERLNAFATFLLQTARDGGGIDVGAEMERFARRHLELTQEYWAKESHCASSAVCGPANFPVARNQKRLDASAKAATAVDDHLVIAKKAVTRTAFPHGAPGGPIRGDNPDAPRLIREKIAALQAEQERMKAANTALRGLKGRSNEAMVQGLMLAIHCDEAEARKIVKPNYLGKRGFEPWQFQNNSAEIRRLEARLSEIEAARSRPAEKAERELPGGIRIVENADAHRIQILFPNKPSAEMREKLKRNGFRWAPSNGAWQRHLNEAGRDAARRILAAEMATS